jgi:hypothetical protein
MLMMESKTSKLFEQLEDVRMGTLEKASFKALLRLQVFFTGRTHELMLEFGKQAQALLLKNGNAEGKLDATGGFRAQRDLLKAWEKTWKMWSDEFQVMREEAVSIPFGVLAVRHERLVIPIVDDPTPDPSPSDESQERHIERGVWLNEAIEDGVFKPQLKILLDAAAEHLYGDSLDLSDRIWKVDRDGRKAIDDVIMQGIADGDSAWNVAKKLEQFLGAGEDCPRWTSTRLYGRTAKEKAAGDTTGLLSGDACDGSGVSYKALRLSRTEIQKAHSLATDKAMAGQPWVEMEQCNLAPGHSTTDECNDVVNGGDNGNGTYEKGTIEYPLHPNCMCYKTAVLMDEKKFTSQLNGWLNGESWQEMDDYAERIGVDLSTSLMNDPVVISLAVWLFGEDLASSG